MGRHVNFFFFLNSWCCYVFVLKWVYLPPCLIHGSFFVAVMPLKRKSSATATTNRVHWLLLSEKEASCTIDSSHSWRCHKHQFTGTKPYPKTVMPTRQLSDTSESEYSNTISSDDSSGSDSLGELLAEEDSYLTGNREQSFYSEAPTSLQISN